MVDRAIQSECDLTSSGSFATFGTMSLRTLSVAAVLGLIIGFVPTTGAGAQQTVPSQTVPPQTVPLQTLRLPFPDGDVLVVADETYHGDVKHPTNGHIAFDFAVPHPSGGFIEDVDILAIGSGEVQIHCVHESGSAVLEQRLDGYDGPALYVHIDINNVPTRFSTTHWEPVEQGDFLGQLYPEGIVGRVGQPCEQHSTGPHLHLDLPEPDMVLDGVVYNEAAPNDGARVFSTNRIGGQETVYCDGRVATIIGSAGNDVLQGTPGPDVIAARQGNDRIFGNEGDDVICGGKGHDTIIGGQGFDILFGAEGNDVLFSSDGSGVGVRSDARGARMFGGAGNDDLYGSDRWDRMQGGDGTDRLYGFEGRDWLRGGNGDDLVFGGGAVDDLRGGPGANHVEQ